MENTHGERSEQRRRSVMKRLWLTYYISVRHRKGAAQPGHRPSQQADGRAGGFPDRLRLAHSQQRGKPAGVCPAQSGDGTAVDNAFRNGLTHLASALGSVSRPASNCVCRTLSADHHLLSRPAPSPHRAAGHCR
jgi:hypothetical protein